MNDYTTKDIFKALVQDPGARLAGRIMLVIGSWFATLFLPFVLWDLLGIRFHDFYGPPTMLFLICMFFGGVAISGYATMALVAYWEAFSKP